MSAIQCSKCTFEEWEYFWIIRNIWSQRGSVTSHNTLVTLLTNFQPVPGHTVTSLRIPRFPELRFCTQTWMQKPPTLLTLTSSSRQAISRSSGSRKIPTPDPISYYSLSLASCFCPTLHSCVSHSCNIAFLCFLLTLPIPLT